MNSIIRTFTGKDFDVFRPSPEMICIEDIAHALSMQCRFGGHTSQFYSVAEHSYWVSEMVKQYKPKYFKLSCLLHDASEAYLVDIPRPIKYLYGMDGYRELEKIVQDAVNKKFGIEEVDYHSVDSRMLYWEAHYLMKNPGDWYGIRPKGEAIEPNCWGPAKAEQKFLERFKELAS